MIGVGYVDDGFGNFELEPHSHVGAGTVIDGTPVAVDTEFEAGELTVLVPASTQSTRLSSSAWDAMGINAGDSFWYLPQSGTTADSLGAPYAGIGTEELDPADWTTNIFITLTGINGPAGGHFSMATVSLGTPTFFMSTADGISGADVWSQPAGDHRHMNWYFTKPGTYDLTFEISGTHVTDGLQSASATYTFTVVPEPTTALLAGLGALGLLRRRR